MRHNSFEIMTGASVLLAAVIVVVLAYLGSGDKSRDGYRLHAQFGHVDGIFIGSDVRLGGVKIGKVTGASIDRQYLTAVLQLHINADIILPRDSGAAIASEGVLGKNFVRITIPKGARAQTETLKDGDTIVKTSDPVSLEDLLGRALFLIGE